MEDNRRRTDIMIDIETLGVSPTAPIISIAAATFNLNEQASAYHDNNIDPSFKLRHGVVGSLIHGLSTGIFAAIDYRSATAVGTYPEIDTMLWWMEQPKQIRDRSFNGKWSMDSVLYNLKRMVQDHTVGADKVRVWSKGASFDIPMLRYQYSERIGRDEHPWKHWNEMCVRTVMNTAHRKGFDTKQTSLRAVTPHDPISDCLAQIRATNECHLYLTPSSRN